MKAIMISINPKFVEKILSGEKTYEYRKSMFHDRSVEKLLIYETTIEKISYLLIESE